MKSNTSSLSRRVRDSPPPSVNVAATTSNSKSSKSQAGTWPSKIQSEENRKPTKDFSELMSKSLVACPIHQHHSHHIEHRHTLPRRPHLVRSATETTPDILRARKTHTNSRLRSVTARPLSLDLQTSPEVIEPASEIEILSEVRSRLEDRVQNELENQFGESNHSNQSSNNPDLNVPRTRSFKVRLYQNRPNLNPNTNGYHQSNGEGPSIEEPTENRNTKERSQPESESGEISSMGFASRSESGPTKVSDEENNAQSDKVYSTPTKKRVEVSSEAENGLTVFGATIARQKCESDFVEDPTTVGNQSTSSIGHEQCRHHHFHHHHHHYHFHSLGASASAGSSPFPSLVETRTDSRHFQYPPFQSQGQIESRENPKEPFDVNQVVTQLLLQLSQNNNNSSINDTNTNGNGLQQAKVLKPEPREKSLKYHRIYSEGVQSTPASPKTLGSKRDRTIRTSSAENTTTNLNAPPTSTTSGTQPQPPSTSQLSKDQAAWLAIATSLKTKMSTRRSGGHPGGHSTSGIAIVETHSPSPSVTSSSHHRPSSRHTPKQASQKQFDLGMRQPSQTQHYDPAQIPPHFDMTQIQHSISALASEQVTYPEVQKVSRSRIASTVASNGSTKESSGDPGVKKERIKNLWGKVGKQGLLQAAAAKQPAAASVPAPTKWDTVLNPLIQKQKQERMILAGDPIPGSYYNTTVGGEAGGGSGFYGQPGNTTMECDCGDDSCPQCNLMLNMGSNW